MFVPLHECLGNLETVLDSLVALAPLPQPHRRHHRPSSSNYTTQTQTQTQSPSSDMNDPQQKSPLPVIKQHTIQRREYRALGVAVEVALTLLCTYIADTHTKRERERERK